MARFFGSVAAAYSPTTSKRPGGQMRTGVFEMVVFDKEIRQSVSGASGEDNLLKVARQKGFTGYREDGAMNVLLGITTVDEVIQAN